MRMWARNTGRAALVAAGAVVAGAVFGSAGVAGAAALHGDAMYGSVRHGNDVDLTSKGNAGVLNGNQVYAPISIPVDVCGNAVAIAGLSKAQCKGGASVTSGGHGYRKHHGNGEHVDLKSTGNYGIGNGNQVYAPIDAPISVCGNAVSVIGAAGAQCKGGASVKRGTGKHVDLTSKGNYGIANGNQVHAPIKAPISVCGNSVGGLGLAGAQCKGGASVGDRDPGLPPTLRTPPKHKVYKPSKKRPAAGKKKLPSTLREHGYRKASAAPDYRRADDLPAVRGFVNSLKRAAPSVPGKLAGKGAPVKVGSPVLS